MAFTVRSKRERRIGLAVQSAVGTMVADTGGFQEMHQEGASLKPNPAVFEHESSSGVRFKTTADRHVSSQQAEPDIGFGGVVLPADIVHLLFGFFHKVTEGGTSPYNKVFELPVEGEAMQPDFTASGTPLTFCERWPGTNESIAAKDGIVRRLNLSLTQAGTLRYSTEIQGSGDVDTTYNPSGTWTSGNIVKQLYHRTLTAAINVGGAGAQNVMVADFELGLSQTVQGFGHDDGSYQSFYIGDYENTLRLKLIKDAAQWKDLVDALRLGTLIDVALTWGSGGTIYGDFSINFTGQIEPSNYEIAAESPVPVEIELMQLQDKASIDTSPLIIAAADDVNRGW